MLLQEIVNKFVKKSWLRLCTLHNINKWDLIDYTKVPVYPGKHWIRPGLEVKTKTCFICQNELDLAIYKGTFLAGCNCQKDSTKFATKEKLSTVLTPSQIQMAFNSLIDSRKKGLPNTVTYWTVRGYSDEEAINKVKEVQANRSLRSPASKKGAKGYSPRTIEYWIKQGFTNEEAKHKIKQVQTTNGIDFYKNKYGNELGKHLYNKRIQQWLDSPGNKNMNANKSKVSLKLFEDIGKGYYGPNEKTVRGKCRVHRVDFILGNKIIEFYGDYWHGNPNIYGENSRIRNKDITDVWKKDQEKVEDLETNGYSVLIIWEKEYRENPVLILKKCKDFVNEN